MQFMSFVALFSYEGLFAFFLLTCQEGRNNISDSNAIEQKNSFLLRKENDIDIFFPPDLKVWEIYQDFLSVGGGLKE